MGLSASGFMRVLVVDQDSALLTAITRLLGEYFTIDAVASKADCQDLLRRNEYEVIVAGERLEDGSGLELLSQMAQSRPDMLRIFAAEPERLKLLKGRLGPFGLFRTLLYPIEPRQLLAALSAAAGIEEEAVEEEEVAQEETVPAPAPPPRAVPQLQTPTRISAVVTGALVGRGGTSAGAGAAGGAAGAAASAGVAPPAWATATAATTAAATPAIAPSPARDVPDRQRSRSRSSARDGVGANATHSADGELGATAQLGSAGRRGDRPNTAARAANRPDKYNAGGTARSRRARQPTPEALALGARLAARARAKELAPPSLEASAKRNAFAIGAGAALVVGAVLLTFSGIFSPRALHTASLTSTQPPTFPPEVLKLVADIETAFQLDDLKGAHTDIVALQQIAPTHPGLPFFESELKKRQAEAQAASAQPPAPPPVETSTTRHSAPRATRQPAADIQRSPTRGTPAGRGQTFSGTTLEDTSTGLAGGNSAQMPSVNGSRTASASAVMHEAHVIHRVPAEYPEDAARKGIEGAVDLSFSISKRGEVYDVSVSHAEPSNIFNRAAIAAVRRWKYQPRTVGGIPVEARVQVRLTFKLDDTRDR
jgi:protein TonB